MKKAGFTLIELLVVIVILGILSTIAVGTFRSYFAKARDAERSSAVQNLALMIKVDSGGEGDCTVYNYTGNLACSEASTERLGTLLANNDYSIPEVKNGLNYYYVFLEDGVGNNNNFFIAVGAEEENAGNGILTLDPTFSIFVDGTTVGIEKAPLCTWTDGVLTATSCQAVGPSWTVIPLTASGVSTGCLTDCTACVAMLDCAMVRPGSCTFQTDPLGCIAN